jgi:hypothetical protein
MHVIKKQKEGDFMGKKELRAMLEELMSEAEQVGNPADNAKATTKPVHRFQCGAVTASVFYKEYTRDGTTYPTYNIAIQRGYTDDSGNWKSTSVFRPSDLHRVMTVTQKAFEAVTMNGKDEDG